jgi:hypothetical protein
MKNLSTYLSLTFLILCSGQTFAQNIKKETFGLYNYLQPRASIALDNAKMYYLKVEISDDELHRRKLIEEELDINNFSLAGASDEYQFTIEIIESDFKFGDSKKKSTSRTVTESGKERSITEYFYEGSMGYSYIVKVLDKQDQELFREIIRGNVTTKGRKSTSYSSALKMYNRDKFLAREKVVNDFIDKASSAINEQFTDVEKTMYMRVPYVKSKKFQYPEFDEAYALLRKSYDALNLDVTIQEETVNDLNKAIELLTPYISEIDLEDKKAKVNRNVASATHFDIGLAYFMMRNYEQAKKHFNESNTIENSVVAGIPNWLYLAETFDGFVKNR